MGHLPRSFLAVVVARASAADWPKRIECQDYDDVSIYQPTNRIYKALLSVAGVGCAGGRGLVATKLTARVEEPLFVVDSSLLKLPYISKPCSRYKPMTSR